MEETERKSGNLSVKVDLESRKLVEQFDLKNVTESFHELMGLRT